MKVGDLMPVSGCVTQDKFILGRSLPEIERNLGFHSGRLAKGMLVVALLELPRADQFSFAGYSQVATHRFKPSGTLDERVAKANVIAGWTLSGPNRLVKVYATTRHDPGLKPDIQYPPGLGVPQWDIHASLRGRVVADVQGYPHGRYR